MRFLLSSARKDLLRIRRDPIGLATWIGIPVLVGVMLAAIFGRGGQSAQPQGLLLIADQDNTFLSSFVPRFYSQGNLSQMLTVRQTPIEEGRRRIAAGEGSALLIIPKGFSQAVLLNEKAEIQLVMNPAQTILPGIVRETTATLVDGICYLQQVFGTDLKQFAASGGLPADFSSKISGLGGYINPPLIDVQTEVVEANPGRSFDMASAMFPSMVFMAVIFLAFGYGGDIWKERMQGVLRRLAVTPASIAGFLAGKLLALCGVYVLLGIAAQIAGAALIGGANRRPVLAVVWLAVSGTGLYLFVLLIHTLGESQRSAGLLANFTIMVLAMIGGCFFPFEIMPEFLARIGRLTPNGWAIVRFKQISSGELSAASCAAPLAAMVAVVAALYVLSLWRLRRKFVV